MMIQKIMSLLLKVTLEKDTRIAFIIKYETWYIQGWKTFFERDWDFSKNHYDKGLVTQEDRQYTKSLIEKLNGSEIISDELVDQYIHT